MFTLDIFSICFKKTGMLCVIIESPHRGNSNECTQYTIFNIKKRKITQIIPNLQLWDFSLDTQK